MATTPAPPELTAEQAAATMASRRFVGLLVLVAVVGIVVSFATWLFLEAIHQITQELYTHLPHALGYQNGPPVWWPLPILAIAGLIVGLAITRLPGHGGHIPAMGLAGGDPPSGAAVPGVLVAGLVGVGFGIVLGPEAPLLVLGPALGVITVTLVRRDTPPQARQVVAAAGAFAAISFLFVSPVIAAVLMLEVTGIGGPRVPLLLVPGLLAAGIGTLLAIGLGSWTGLNRSAIALGPVHLPPFAHPTVGQFGWTIAVAIVIAIVAHVIIRGGLATHEFAAPRAMVVLPIVGLIVAGLAIAFSQIEDKSVNYALFSGESGLPLLVSNAGTFSLGALALLLLCKGLAYSLSLGSFRGGPTFPAVFLGAVGGLMASHLPGFPMTPAVAVGMGAATVAVLRLPLSAVVLATLLTTQSGIGSEPLIIVGVVVAYLVTLQLSRPRSAEPTPVDDGRAVPQASGRPRSVPVSSNLLDIFLLSLLAIFNPTLIAAVTVMLLLPNPKRLMLGYLLGAYTTSITLGLVIVFSLHGSSTERTSKHTVSPVEDIAVGLLVLVIALVLATGRDQPLQERRQRKKEAKLKEKEAAGKPTESLPLRLLGKGDPRVTFAVGAVLSFPGVTYLDTLDHIHKLDPGTVATVLLVVYFCLVQQLFLEPPLLGYLFAPKRTQDTVNRFQAWMGRSGRTAAVIAAFVIGGLLIARGVITLL